jgi:hypothetical protein
VNNPGSGWTPRWCSRSRSTTSTPARR